MQEFIRNYRKYLSPPSTRKDIVTVVATLLVLFILPVAVVVVSRQTNLYSRAVSDSHLKFVNPQTLQVIESTTSVQVSVLLTPPWPIAVVQDEGDVAGVTAPNPTAQPPKGVTPNPTHQPPKGATNPPTRTTAVNPTAQPPKGATNPPTRTTVPTQRVASVVLAQDANFTQNVVTIAPLTTNPYLTRYTFSNSTPGTKFLFAKFVSNTGLTQMFNSSIRLVSSSTTNSTTPPVPPIQPNNNGNGNRAPYSNAPLCPDSGTSHTNSTFHTLWDSVRGCHYDHEHGSSPFTQAVTNAFPGFNLRALQCGKEVGHCNPSSPVENEEAHHGGKHGGMKWQVDTSAPQACNVGFEGGQIAIDAYAVMHHNLGRQDVEFEARQHSGVFLLRQCKESSPSDKGYMFVGQLIEYGQRVMPYQGITLPYPNRFLPEYDSPRGPYFTTECFGDGSALGIACRPTFNFGGNNLSIWTSKPTGGGARPPTSSLAGLLFRSRDNYQRLDVRDMTHPFTWRFVCSSDGGLTYNPAGCRYNNSTTTVQELAGTIPAAWDNLVGFDTDPRVGRITAQGFVTRYGTLATNCTAPGGLDCQPIKMVSAFVGFYSSELSEGKVSNPTPADTPESDIYFCGTQVCSETSPGAVPSGWIGSEN